MWMEGRARKRVKRTKGERGGLERSFARSLRIGSEYWEDHSTFDLSDRLSCRGKEEDVIAAQP